MLWEKTKVTIGTFYNKLVNCLTTPLERLEYLQEKKEEELRKVCENVTELQANIKELEKSQESMLKTIEDATQAAEVGLANNVPETQILKIISRRNSLQASYDENAKYLAETKAKLESLKLLVKEYEAGIDEIKLQITQLNTESKISGVKVKIAETTSGLGQNDFQIQKNLKQGREEVDKENARADAIMELNEEGFYDGLKGGSAETQVDGILAETKARADLEAMKAKLEKLDEKFEE